jgi:hypothetical protein
MIYPAQKFSNGVEDTGEKATFSSNSLPLHVLHGNKIAVFVAHVYRTLDWNFYDDPSNGEGSEADCYTALINNLNMNTLCHREFCTLTGLNDKDKFIGEQRTVCMVCLHC